MLNKFSFPKIDKDDMDDIWFQQDGATCHTANVTIHLLRTVFENQKTPSVEPIHRPRNRLSALNFAGIWFQLKVAYDSSVIRSPGTPIRGHTPVRQAD